MYSVYALSDPRTQEVKYIGMSSNVQKRYKQHLYGHDKSNKAKQAWIDDLKKHGLLPVLTVLEDNLDKQTALRSEISWLQRYLEQDAELTNMRDSTLTPIELRCSPEELQEIIEYRRMKWEQEQHEA